VLLIAGAVGAQDLAVNRQALDVLKRENDRLERYELDNGILCLLKEDHSAPLVSIQIWVGTGSIHEQNYLGSGISHAIEHMVFNGTPTRDAGDISREIADAGGRINAYTTLDRTVFFTDLPSRRWREGFDALADSVLHPTFPAEEWKEERGVILREFAMGRDDPHRVMTKFFFRSAFLVHPYRFPVIGHEEIFRTLERDDLAAFYDANYVTDNTVVVIVGSIDTDVVKGALRDTFGAVPRTVRPPVVLPAEPAQTSLRFARQTGHVNVTRVVVAHQGVAMSHADAPALDLLAAVLGRGRSSRLVQTIKEEKALVHSISAWSYTPKGPGLFGVQATLDPAKEEAVLAAIDAELAAAELREVSDEEIRRAKRMILTSTLSELTTIRGQADSYGSGLFYANDPRFSETYLSRLESLCGDDLQRVARVYLRESNRTISVLSPDQADGGVTRRDEESQLALPERLELSNGMPLIVRENHRLPFVSFAVAFKGGLLSEDEGNCGITALMAELLLRGTSQRSHRDIVTMVDSLGGYFAPFSGNNSFGLKARCLSGDADRFAKLLGECLADPTFPADEIEKQKTLQVASIRKQEERPMFLAQKALREALFGKHPYRWNRLGEEATVGALDRRRVRDHYRRHARTGNAVLTISGDVGRGEAIRLAETVVAGLPKGQVAFGAEAGFSASLPSRIVLREPREQAIILAGFPGVSVLDSTHDALNVLQTAMSGLSSDLALSVRGERGLAYFVGAYDQPGLHPGLFAMYAGTRADAVADVEELLRAEMQRVREKGIRSEELERARNQLIADHEKGLQDDVGVAMTCSLNELYGLGYDHAFSAADRLNAITLDDITSIAGEILNTNRMVISVLLPESSSETSE